ncbi:MAG: DUF4157 domain-containing protein [Anaerolineaceae bacterium]|nr:DUF4157 domain-containing protein [Anaerolineaceae bacterium]
MRVNRPGDRWEQEADRLAESTLTGRIPDPISSITTTQPLVRIGDHSPRLSDVPVSVHDTLTSPGQPLESGTQNFMENRFGHNFCHVRVHTDQRAAKSAAHIQALAYTVGRNIVFGAGQYSPDTSRGKRLLAHELTHVVQQQAFPGLLANTLQGDWRITPVNYGAVPRTLSAPIRQVALMKNRKMLTKPNVIKIIRDVIGMDHTVTTIDNHFIDMVLRWQAAHGIPQDGQVGPLTAMYIAEELEAGGVTSAAQQIRSQFRQGTVLDMSTRFCGCQDELRKFIKSSTRNIRDYKTCRDNPVNKNANDINKCIIDSNLRRGRKPRLAGWTTQSGEIHIAPIPGPCGKILEKSVFVHEFTHYVQDRDLEARFGIGSYALYRQRNDPKDWANSEIKAHSQDIDFAYWAIGILDNICPKTQKQVQTQGQP